MNPVLKTYLAGAVAAACGAGVSWAISKGIVPEADKDVLTNGLAALVVAALGTGAVWFQARLSSPKGLIQSIGASDPHAVKVALEQAPIADQTAVNKAVNDARNGLKVVPADSTSVSAVNAPLASPATKAN